VFFVPLTDRSGEEESTVRQDALPQPHQVLISAMTAARLFLPPANCGLIVDRGIDFPNRFARELEALGDEMMFYRSRQGDTTRALNSYSGSKIGQV
jgi:hypothetical protein